MKYALATLFTLAALPALAATSISTTLTMTSPSAVISMTGVSATAYLTNVSATNVSATQLGATNVSTTNIQVGTVLATHTIPCASLAYDLNNNVSLASTSLITSMSRGSTGQLNVSGTFPSRPWPICIQTQANQAVALETSPSNTTAGFGLRVFDTNSGSNANSSGVMCQVYCQ